MKKLSSSYLLIIFTVFCSIYLSNCKINLPKIQLAINCGGDSVKTPSGIKYIKDKYFSGGESSDFGSGQELKLTEDHEIYQTERWSKEDLLYKIPIKGEGSFVLILQFSEVYFNSKGEKMFDVEVNGQKVIENLDIFEKVGKYTALDEFIKIDLKGGSLKVKGISAEFDGEHLEIKFIKKEKDNPKINGIILVKGTLEDTHYKDYMERLEMLEKVKTEKERKGREFQRMSKSIDYEDFEDDFVDDGRFNLRGGGLFSFKGIVVCGIIGILAYFLFSK